MEYLEALFDLLDEHVTISGETIHCQDCTIGTVATRGIRIVVEEDVGGDLGHTA